MLEVVGRRIGPFTVTYGWKDVVIYALGVGAGFAEIEYCYEKALKVIPTFASAALGDTTSLRPPRAASTRGGAARRTGIHLPPPDSGGRKPDHRRCHHALLR
jgi:hypothetical protein